MANVVVVGAQWGDEGKGKIVDVMSRQADVVVRFQGGHNAGHTIIVGDKTYKLSLLPSGVIRPGIFSIIGPGVVLDPLAFLSEVERLAQQGVVTSPDTLMIAENTSLILPLHQALDAANERARSANVRIGTTGRGIGPAYEDTVGRRAIRLCDLADPDELMTKLVSLCARHNIRLASLEAETFDAATLHADLMELAPRLLPYAGIAWQTLEQAKTSNKQILFEGAQGTLLDITHGTYPFVTSSSTIAGQAAAGSGVGPNSLDYILGIVKAYTTRVGSGPFPTECLDEIGETLGQRGHEFGVVTGRKRRCGWFDAVLVRQSARLNGLNGMALTKIDVLDSFENIKICTAYELNGEQIHHLPARASAQAACKPIYETLPGWRQTTQGIRKLEDMPKAARAYISRLEELTQVPLALLSTSPDRDDTAIVRDPYAK